MKQKLLVAAFGLVLAANANATIFEWTSDELAVQKDYAEKWSFMCKISAEDAFQVLRQNYVLPKKEEIFVLSLIFERECRKATYNILSDTPWERVANKKRIDDLYQDSIDVRLLPYNDKVAGANISMALRFADNMGIGKENYTKIMNLGLSVAKHLRIDPSYNYDIEVMDSLRNYLKKTQLIEMLSAKHALTCIQKGVATWNELQNAGMVMDEDSATCCNQAIDYYTMECVINEMFVGHEKQLKKNLSDLWKRQPLIVRMSGSLRNKKELTSKKSDNEPEVNDLKW
jgi:hypothetical protein